MKLELGCGTTPRPGYDLYNDRTAHSEHVNAPWDLEVVPWPWTNDSIEEVQATDVFEHLSASQVTLTSRVEYMQGPLTEVPPWHYWLDECWRILQPEGRLSMRLPAWDNGLSYRDPTHRGVDGAARVFHPETFDFWDPCREVWAQFGQIYDLSKQRYWHRLVISREAGDCRYLLRKVGPEHVPSRT